MSQRSTLTDADAVPSGSRELLPALARLPGHLMWRSAARVTVALDEVLPPGVDLHAYAVLLALGDGEALSQQDLARRVGVSGTTMVRVAAKLVAEGLVDRVRNPVDRRSYALTRTGPGAAAARTWQRHAEELQGRLTAGLSRADGEELIGLLRLVAEDDLAEQTPEALRSSLAFLVSQIHFAMHRAFIATLEPLGIEPRHFGSLTALQALGPVTQSELARAMGVSAASMVQMTDDLEDRGLVERRRSASDRRSHRLIVTRRGRDACARAGVLAHRQSQDRFAVLGTARTERLIDLLGLFVGTA